MKTYTFYFDYEAGFFPFDEEDKNGSWSTQLEVTYSIKAGHVYLESAKVNTWRDKLDILPFLLALENTSMLVELATSHNMKLSVGQMYKNYPELAKTPTLEEKVEMLKLK